MRFPKSKMGGVFVAIYLLFILAAAAYSFFVKIDLGDRFNRSLFFTITITPWLGLMPYKFIRFVIGNNGVEWIFSLLFFILNILFLYFIGYFFTWILRKRKSRSA